MRTRLTIAQYIQKPLTAKEIAYFKKRGRIEDVTTSIFALVVFIYGIFADMPSPSLNIVICLFGSFLAYLLTLMAFSFTTGKNNFWITDEITINDSGMFKNKPLYNKHKNLKIEDAQTLIKNVNALNRDFIKLERDIIQDLLCKQINLKTKDLFAKEGELA